MAQVLALASPAPSRHRVNHYGRKTRIVAVNNQRTPSADEPAYYLHGPGPTRPATPAKKTRRGKRVGVALVATVLAWAAIATITTANRHHTPRATERPTAPSSRAPGAPGTPFPNAPFEYLWADQPTTPSYHPSYGVGYDLARGFFGPVEASITRNRAGDYTLQISDLPDGAGTARVSAYGGPSNCYNAEQDTSGHHVRVVCLNLATPAPHTDIGPIPYATTDSRFTLEIVGANRSPHVTSTVPVWTAP